jgi:uncharacterized membrane protein
MTATSVPAAAPSRPALFSAVLYPHRSLQPLGFSVLMTLACVVSFALGLGFASMGAWPVTGFFGLDLLLLYVALKLNYRQGRLSEFVQLTPEALVVRRVQPSGKSETWSFPPDWVRVRIDDPPRRESQLTLSSHGRTVAIGAFLTPEERLEFARVLQQQLRALCPYRSG